MIKAVISDVDGVMIGNKKGLNFPLPTPEVMAAFKTLRERNIPLVLCTGKVSYSIENLIVMVGLDGPHIGDGGTLIFNPIQHQVIRKHVLDSKLVKELAHLFLENNFHFAVNTTQDTYVDKNHNSEITQKRSEVVEKDLVVTPSLLEEIDKLEVIKALVTLTTDEEKSLARTLLEPYKDRVNLFWNSHPMTGEWEYAVITQKGISKRSAAKEVAESLGIQMSEVLGIGDTMGDWVFLQDCGYVGIVGQKHQEVLDLARKKGEGHYFLAPSVDENGMVEVLKYFKLI